MEIQENVEEKINKAAEEKLKKTYGVSNIRMPGSAILASEIEEKLVDVTIAFRHAIWGWANIYKGINETVQNMRVILRSTPIHPSLLFARTRKANSSSMNPFEFEQYCSGDFDPEGSSNSKLEF